MSIHAHVATAVSRRTQSDDGGDRVFQCAVLCSDAGLAR